MNKFFFVAAVAVGLCLGCNPEENPEMGDAVSCEILVSVTDPSGRDLLDPALAENWLSVEYRYDNQVYYATEARDGVPNALYRPTALQYRYDEVAGHYVLAFGDFFLEDDCLEQSFTIVWDPCSSDEVFFRVLRTQENGVCVVKKELYLNGVPVPVADRFELSFTRELPLRLSPVAIVFTQRDAEGRDLLNPAVEGNLLAGAICVTCDGETFEPVTVPAEETRRPVASKALRHSYDDELGCYVLALGEFGLAERSREVIVDWGNGTTQTVVLNYYREGDPCDGDLYRTLDTSGWTDMLNMPRLVDSALIPEVNCDQDIIWDFVNYFVCMEVVDAEGHDLLDPDTPGNVLDRELKAVFRGQMYPLLPEGSDTRYLPPMELGLRRWYHEPMQRYLLLFGEFSPTDQWKDATFTLDWGDGTQDRFQFDCYIWWSGRNRAEVEKRLYVNGVKNENEYPFHVTVVK